MASFPASFNNLEKESQKKENPFLLDHHYFVIFLHPIDQHYENNLTENDVIIEIGCIEYSQEEKIKSMIEMIDELSKYSDIETNNKNKEIKNNKICIRNCFLSKWEDSIKEIKKEKINNALMNLYNEISIEIKK